MSEVKKRGRKKKTDTASAVTNGVTEAENIQIQIIPIDAPPEKILKKRGRKPKGGKLTVLTEPSPENEPVTKNVILHLKCSHKDLLNDANIDNSNLLDPLVYNPSVPPKISTYDLTQENNKFSLYDNENDDSNVSSKVVVDAYEPVIVCSKCRGIDQDQADSTTEVPENVDEMVGITLKDVHAKLKKLKIHYYKNTPNNKNSACFWCTYDFDNPPSHIPKYEIDGVIHGYGSFCRPECAVAYLMKENLDDSTKFERYHLLNRTYGKIFGFKKNIKPAPNPYYLLDKFYGSLSIQEYRKLLQTEYLLSVVDKPMTRFLPEIHEDNDEFIMNIYGESNHTTQSGGMYKVKRASEKQTGPSKNSIIQNNFGGGGGGATTTAK